MSTTFVGLKDDRYLVQSHVGQIIFSTTLDTEDKVKQYYGGTSWAKIEGKFLIGANDSYANGSTGGEAMHTLTEDELPTISGSVQQHGEEHGTHVFDISGHCTGVKIDNMFQTTGETDGAYSYGSVGFKFGGDQPHNNMPPYRAVYIWERTA